MPIDELEYYERSCFPITILTLQLILDVFFIRKNWLTCHFSMLQLQLHTIIKKQKLIQAQQN
jgi:hypothetical protein